MREMKKLSIIIPYHNEDEEKITPMFSSLDAQFNVDWDRVEILFSNDHNSPKNMNDFFKMFPKVNQVNRSTLSTHTNLLTKVTKPC